MRRADIREVVLRCGDGVDEAEREIFYRVFDKILDNLLAVCEQDRRRRGGVSPINLMLSEREGEVRKEII